MSELESYLQSKSADGHEQELGSFTLSGEAARRKLADSVPERVRSAFAAVACFVLAAQDLGLRIGDLADFDYNMAQDGQLVLLAPSKSSREQMATYVDTLTEAYENPFQSSEPVHRKLSRAIIILAQIECSFSVFRFKAGRKDFPHAKDKGSYRVRRRDGEQPRRPEAGELTIEFWGRSFTGGARVAMLNSERSSRALANFRHFYHFSLLLSLQQRVSVETPNILGFATERDSLWTKLSSREVSKYTHISPTKDWFYRRVSQGVVVLEYLVPTTQASLLSVATSQMAEAGTLRRPSEKMSSWDRVRSKAENLILHFVAPSEDLASAGKDSTEPKTPGRHTTPVKAIFTVVLSQATSQVAFVSEETTCELVALPKLPPGLAAVVYWPGLKADLYASGWVRDDKFEEALDWCQNHGEMIFKLLTDESEYIKKMVRQDHVFALFRSKVLAKIDDWLRPTASAN